MFINKTTKQVKDLFSLFEELSFSDKLQVLITIFEEWGNNQINSLNEANPNLLDEAIKIEIFNPECLGYENALGNKIAQSLFITLEAENIKKTDNLVIHTILSNYVKYTSEAKRLISAYSKFFFVEKIDVVKELFIKLEADNYFREISDLPFENGFDIASSIDDYKKH